LAQGGVSIVGGFNCTKKPYKDLQNG